MSQVKELLDKLASGDFTSVIPQSRLEACLKNCLAGLGTEGSPPPMSEVEGYLHTIAEKGVGGSDPITDFGYFCHSGRRLDVVENGLNTSPATKFNYMFYNCTSLVSAPQLDTGNGTDFSCMFYGCSKLTTVPEFNTKNGTNFSGMFRGCASLTSVPPLDTKNVTDFSYMFYGCTKLKSVPPLDTKNGKKFSYMFSDAHGVSPIDIDLRNAESVSYLLGIYTPTVFPTLYLRNIKISISIASRYPDSRSAGKSNIIRAIRELIDVGSAKTLTIGSYGVSQIANTYVRLVHITDEMRAEDEFIDLKLPFEECESTDEGAMLITDYVGEKNWSLK